MAAGPDGMSGGEGISSKLSSTFCSLWVTSGRSTCHKITSDLGAIADVLLTAPVDGLNLQESLKGQLFGHDAESLRR